MKTNSQFDINATYNQGAEQVELSINFGPIRVTVPLEDYESALLRAELERAETPRYF